MHKFRRHVENEQGGTLVITAVSIAVLLSMAALAIDLGMLFQSRNEAQRTADAAALAGASTFLTPLAPDQVVPTAVTRAEQYAGFNRVRNTPVQPDEVGVQVLVSEARVRAIVTRRAIPLWFARIFGVSQHDVAAVAAAQMQPSGTADCIAPMMIPDWWVDSNANGIYNAGERYESGVTSYGTTFRDPGQEGAQYVPSNPVYYSDIGRRVTLKTGSPGSTMGSGWYFPIRIGENTGGADFRADLGQGCPPRTLSVGDQVYNEPGAMQGPTKQGLQDRIGQDPNAVWVEGVGIQNSAFPRGCSGSACTGDGSPRIMVVPLFDPRNPVPNGSSAPQRVHNFGSFFIESLNGQGDIIGRWMKVRGKPDNCMATNTCIAGMGALRLVE